MLDLLTVMLFAERLPQREAEDIDGLRLVQFGVGIQCQRLGEVRRIAIDLEEHQIGFIRGPLEFRRDGPARFFSAVDRDFDPGRKSLVSPVHIEHMGVRNNEAAVDKPAGTLCRLAIGQFDVQMHRSVLYLFQDVVGQLAAGRLQRRPSPRAGDNQERDQPVSGR